MRTLTVTFHHTTNYGAVLQTFALQQFILGLGHENMVLETVSIHKKKSPKSLYQVVRDLYFIYLKLKHRKTYQRLKDHFSRFHTEKIKLTVPYHTMNELLDTYPDVDCLISGSDQVWNMKTTPEFIDARLLKFGKPSWRRFSYAASIEELNYTLEQQKQIKEALQSFAGISLREESAKNYIESITGVNCERVLDPVFLLSKNQWLEFVKTPRIDGPFILCYQVQSNKRMREVAVYLRKKTGYPIVSICNSPIEWIKSDYILHDVSIEEFIGFYSKAAYVISASFHGIAMALVFEKPVYALVKSVRANRIKEIMSLMGLDNYVITQESQSPITEYTQEIISKYIEIKTQERKKSISFLEQMLSV